MYACMYVWRREISAEDKYLVVASDGVFEFLTNQMVADLIAPHSDPLEAHTYIHTYIH